jgi:nucleoside phosphorylase
LHFFDVHFLEMKGINEEGWRIRRCIEYECRMATRIAILAADEVLVPAASFFESKLCNKILDEFKDIYHSGILRLIGSGTSVREYIDDKLGQYPKSSPQFQCYRELQKRVKSHPPFYPRIRSASRDISQGWVSPSIMNTIGSLVEGSRFLLPRDFEYRWETAPDRLEGSAFIVPHVEPIILDNPAPLMIKNRLHKIINELYFKSFTQEFCAGVITELYYLGTPYLITSYDQDLPYNDIMWEFRQRDLMKRVQRANGGELLQLKYDLAIRDSLAVAISNHEKRAADTNIIATASVLRELSAATIGIITALPEEFAAICEVLGCGEPITVPGVGAGRKYAMAKICNRNGEYLTVAATFLTGMGNNSAAIRASQLYAHCKNVQQVIMVGIAGAVPYPAKPADHVRLGDIVISDQGGVIQYDMDKEMSSTTEHRNPPRPPSATLIEADRLLNAEELRGKYPWEEYIDRAIRHLGESWRRPSDDKDKLHDWQEMQGPVEHPLDHNRRPGRPRIFRGSVASANKLLKNPSKRDALRDKFKVKAVEMEGSGIADASWNAGNGYFIIRGTSDYCNSDKGDEWHNYASIIAAAYARALIEVVST